MKNKKCTKCKRIKLITCFQKDKSKKNGFYSSCKSCVLKYSKSLEAKKTRTKYLHRPDVHKKSLEYAKEYRERPAEKEKRKLYQQNPSFKKKRKLYRIQKNYNITVEDYNELLLLQKNKCAICGNTLKRTHIDHCHKTGKVRGILCPSCNFALGFFKDDPKILKKAIKYLKS